MSKSDYHVHLGFKMSSESPGDAVQDVIDTFVEKGFRDLVYVVSDIATSEPLGFFNGWGEPIETSVVEAAAARLRSDPEEPQSDAASTVDDETESTYGSDEPDEQAKADADDALERLAEQLNTQE